MVMRCMALLGLVAILWANSVAAEPMWHQSDPNSEPRITLYFVWSETCPHCAEAHPFIDALAAQYPWLELVAPKVTDASTGPLWSSLAQATGTPANSVPYMAVCERAVVGYNGDGVTGAYLQELVRACYQQQGGDLSAYPPLPISEASGGGLFATCDEGSLTAGSCGLDTPVTPAQVAPVKLPLLGTVAPETLSLPLLTVVLAGVDAFNPCAFFVLLFLLSILVNARSRRRMLLVGGIFVFFSGFIYFLFMTAWLNLFVLLGGAGGGVIMIAAGLLALSAGAINVREYTTSKGDVSLSMSTQNRSSLIKRMGQLTKASSLPTLIAGTVVLAILANAYELLCTAGFPMIFTSVLSLHDLTQTQRYLYLVFYNLVYVVPLALIVLVFALTMGKRKLTEKEGQTLKLMSGLMMMGMGALLVWDPTLLQSPAIAIGLILFAILLTAIIALGRKAWGRRAQA
ncbi:cytochrome C biosynthesis protein [Ferrimonas marina]|uniref:Cytochrome c biogenesis protein CcdA n=2 Tax=Ferrimonas marina TaxID=299255 RepID=A0A1M5X3N4_9GAMM|nr:cytochrome C biosynthesis protein [Ferrimonas marina]SHH94124.1 hypothetical protein SAMN02745129_3176 [Ferrimonas marina]